MPIHRLRWVALISILAAIMIVALVSHPVFGLFDRLMGAVMVALLVFQSLYCVHVRLKATRPGYWRS